MNNERILKESTRSNGKSLLTDEDKQAPNQLIKLRRTPAQQAQRDEFLKATTLARNWLNNIICFAEKDNWSEVEYLLRFTGATNDRMKDALPTDRAELQGD